ncbi:hypothetical protein TWF481_005065 [Arthrobotrys musiformis]|uniref:Uncharacterized protein n=1 Tax=Arthrobotrys musiformis TaxID=47236 RepID=A0AAV9WIC7_9PEZI
MVDIVGLSPEPRFQRSEAVLTLTITNRSTGSSTGKTKANESGYTKVPASTRPDDGCGVRPTRSKRAWVAMRPSDTLAVTDGSKGNHDKFFRTDELLGNRRPLELLQLSHKITNASGYCYVRVIPSASSGLNKTACLHERTEQTDVDILGPETRRLCEAGNSVLGMPIEILRVQESLRELLAPPSSNSFVPEPQNVKRNLALLEIGFLIEIPSYHSFVLRTSSHLFQTQNPSPQRFHHSGDKLSPTDR